MSQKWRWNNLWNLTIDFVNNPRCLYPHVYSTVWSNYENLPRFVPLVIHAWTKSHLPFSLSSSSLNIVCIIPRLRASCLMIRPHQLPSFVLISIPFVQRSSSTLLICIAISILFHDFFFVRNLPLFFRVPSRLKYSYLYLRLRYFLLLHLPLSILSEFSVI